MFSTGAPKTQSTLSYYCAATFRILPALSQVAVRIHLSYHGTNQSINFCWRQNKSAGIESLRSRRKFSKTVRLFLGEDEISQQFKRRNCIGKWQF
jgi:hypothetical protein